MPVASLNYLVAEDHEFQRRMLVRMLGDLGAQGVQEADDGQAALAIVRDPNRPVDVIISDLDMPGMDGMEFIRHLGALERRMSLIIVSAIERKLLASVATMTEAYGINLLGIIEKPVTRDKLKALLETCQPATVNADRPVATGLTFTLDEIVAGLRNDEFEPFFQPKIELMSGRIKGAEALARWRHPQRGVVAPYAFIKTMEDNALIDELTWVMLRKAAAFCGRWRASGFDVTVAVNVSLKSLADPQLADRVTQLVCDQDVEPRHLVLEVTETSAITEMGNALENLARLRMRGFGLSIDDYGTGYSSMQQLMRIAFTELKIDQSFVAEAAREEAARVILKSSIGMAKNLGIAAVGEGVETQADWDLLRHLGCDIAQGYFIDRPMEGAACLEWSRGWKQ